MPSAAAVNKNQLIPFRHRGVFFIGDRFMGNTYREQDQYPLLHEKSPHFCLFLLYIAGMNKSITSLAIFQKIPIPA